MARPKPNDEDIREHTTVYLTEYRNGWTVSVDLAHGGEIAHYEERAPAVLAARAEAVVRHAWLLVHPRRGAMQFLSPEQLETAVIAGEPPP